MTEVLISVSLMTIVLLLLNTSFFSMTQSSQSVTTNTARLNDLRLTRHFITDQISSMRPLSFRHQDGDLRVYFAGNESEMRYAGALPAHRGGGGLHFLQLSLAEDSPAELVLYDMPASPGIRLFESDVAEDWRKTVLLPEVGRLSFSYFGPGEDGTRHWVRVWEHQDQLPERVKVEFDTDQGATLPPLIAEVRTRSVASQPYLVW